MGLFCIELHPNLDDNQFKMKTNISVERRRCAVIACLYERQFYRCQKDKERKIFHYRLAFDLRESVQQADDSNNHRYLSSDNSELTKNV